MRGDDPDAVTGRWIAGVEPYLRGALEELPAPARLWLSRRLAITPDHTLLRQAELDQWEEITTRSVQRLLVGGAPPRLESQRRGGPEL